MGLGQVLVCVIIIPVGCPVGLVGCDEGCDDGCDEGDVDGCDEGFATHAEILVAPVFIVV